MSGGRGGETTNKGLPPFCFAKERFGKYIKSIATIISKTYNLALKSKFNFIEKNHYPVILSIHCRLIT